MREHSALIEAIWKWLLLLTRQDKKKGQKTFVGERRRGEGKRQSVFQPIFLSISPSLCVRPVIQVTMLGPVLHTPQTLPVTKKKKKEKDQKRQGVTGNAWYYTTVI